MDEALKEGPVHVIRNDEPRYVILDEQHYRELVEAQQEAYRARIREALQDVREGHVRRSTAQEIIDEFGLED